jgi:hypothetical protein
MHLNNNLTTSKSLLILAALFSFSFSTQAKELILLNKVDVFMVDAMGDGWNGNTLTIYDNAGTEVAIAEMTCCTTEVVTFYLPDGCFTLSVEGGTNQNEIDWTIDVNGIEVLSGGAPASNVLLPVDDNTCATNTGCDLVFDGTDIDYELCPGANDGRVLLMADCNSCTSGLLYSLGGSTFQSSPTFNNLAAGIMAMKLKMLMTMAALLQVL